MLNLAYFVIFMVGLGVVCWVIISVVFREEIARLKPAKKDAVDLEIDVAALLGPPDSAPVVDAGSSANPAPAKAKRTKAKADTKTKTKTKANPIRHWDTALHGVRYGGRQDAILASRLREPLKIEHEADNPKDESAIIVSRKNGDNLGYIPAGLGGGMLKKSANGVSFSVFVLKYLEPNEDYDSTGIVVLVVEAGPDVSEDEVRSYVDDLHGRSRA